MKKLVIGIGLVIVLGIVAYAWYFYSPLLSGKYEYIVITGTSMEPGLKNGDKVKLDKEDKNYQRADIIAYRDINNSSAIYLKRIIALPGETIEIKDLKFRINGQVLNESYETVGAILPHNTEIKFPLSTKSGEYFVVGDSRLTSADSRDNGPIASAQIIGKVVK